MKPLKFARHFLIPLIVLLTSCGGGGSDTSSGAASGEENLKYAGRVPVRYETGMEDQANRVVYLLMSSQLAEGYSVAFTGVTVKNTISLPCHFSQGCIGTISHGGSLTGWVTLAGLDISRLSDSKLDRLLAHELEHKIAEVVYGHSNLDHSLPMPCQDVPLGGPMSECPLTDYLNAFNSNNI